jgi:hypothetical protein
MTIAQDIINGQMPDFDYYLNQGESLNDIDEYGFTPLIESVITRQLPIAMALLSRKVDVNKTDVTSHTPLHWAVDNNDIDMTRLLVKHGANTNAYTNAGLSILVYPILRGQNTLKHLLYQYHAKLNVALDFINAKLIGHRYELQGDTDIVNANDEFIEVDFEGFILEFTVAIIKDSLHRFTNSYSTRHFRHHFSYLHTIMDAFEVAAKLLQLQHHPRLTEQDRVLLSQLINSPILILPAASRGHALCFIRCQQWWAKIDRGENSLKEGSVNIYQITQLEQFTVNFLCEFLYKKQARHYFHETINQQLGLLPIAKLPISAQITGNCSWANVQAAVPVAYVLQQLMNTEKLVTTSAMDINDVWVEWDKDRALDECIYRFSIANPLRKASIAAILGAILFQSCDHNNKYHLIRAEKIVAILNLPDYYYILKSYLETYCIKRLTKKGNNLLKLLDDCGINPDIGISPIATGLKPEES